MTFTAVAWSLLALRRAIEDAGVSPDQVDGLVVVPETTTGAYWPQGRPVPKDIVNAFNPTSDPLDGIAKLSAEWIVKDMPEPRISSSLCTVRDVCPTPSASPPKRWEMA
jgi:hypothetical protein